MQVNERCLGNQHSVQRPLGLRATKQFSRPGASDLRSRCVCAFLQPRRKRRPSMCTTNTCQPSRTPRPADTPDTPEAPDQYARYARARSRASFSCSSDWLRVLSARKVYSSIQDTHRVRREARGEKRGGAKGPNQTQKNGGYTRWGERALRTVRSRRSAQPATRWRWCCGRT